MKDLVAGSGMKFEDFGTHTLKGLPEEWQDQAVTTVNATGCGKTARPVVCPVNGPTSRKC